ncbi:hypothetical protein SBOR_4251 [Sclerotinia borealis F-4128]|uniref:Uncharacterized protein n=1 Tax=Sclerotinia borealis (strain F-4128) TaxID=1432307 RepID=W9CLM1_SCLBF|nr:hypothetical protein SBOR_4251 [Sclerotinia borealis F-4128]
MCKPAKSEDSCIHVSHHGWTCSPHLDPNSPGTVKCGRRGPEGFIESLDSPSLRLLQITFPCDTTGPMLLSFVRAVESNCRFQNLTELVLGGGSWFTHWYLYPERPPLKIRSEDLREAVKILLPMPQLKVLQLSVASGFLDDLDLALFQNMANAMPSLEKLYLNYADSFTIAQYYIMTHYERIPVHHLAAFCSMFKNLKEVGVGTVDGISVEENPKEDWICKDIKTLKVGAWAGRDELRGGNIAESPWGGGISRGHLYDALRTFFPESDMAKVGFSRHDQWIWYESIHGDLSAWETDWAAMKDGVSNSSTSLGLSETLVGLDETSRLEEES